MALPKKSSAGKRSTKKGLVKRAPPRKAAPKKRAPAAPAPPDVSLLSPEFVTREDRYVCLACVLDVMTRHLGLSARKAQMEVKQYAPTPEEVRARVLSRPFFTLNSENDPCPYCRSAAKWHARLAIYRIENTEAADARRRAFLKSLPEGGFVVLEEKVTRQQAFFEWVEKLSASIHPDDPVWLREVSRSYLGRKDPKTDWGAPFAQIHAIRRSRRLEDGWEIDRGRLFLAPLLFDELLLVQYLVSRAHRAGGLTLEGRYTLPELFNRLRNSGYLHAAGVEAHNPSDAFEQLLIHLGGGEGSLRVYYAVDRRDLLERVKALKDLRVPRATRQ